MDVAIDYLKIWQAPKIKQLRPRQIPVFAREGARRSAQWVSSPLITEYPEFERAAAQYERLGD
jgi:hypothetical protein